ncbi:hypothetical protein RR42_s2436 [Cupriavidus basilensis]|uniref:Uncharacterized protein n=1 Tax=Cupriavidus basilensis TaxID=68895 RepID=A0A0C4YLT7_9BURK|nr:hypothetical protein RR42_s2436 [Cupriavidus basilensis]
MDGKQRHAHALAIRHGQGQPRHGMVIDAARRQRLCRLSPGR